MTRCVCFQPDRLSCRIEKVSAKDGEMDCRNTNRPVRYHGRIGFTSHERELLMITNDGSGDPRFFTACFKLLIDDLPVGLRHGADSNRFHLFMTEAYPSDRQCTKTNTSNDQALLGTQLHRMINNPN